MKNMQLLSDEALIKGFLSGAVANVDILIDRHKNRVFSYIMLNVKNRDLADDIFQETFVKVIHSLKKGQYTDNGRFSSWILRIAHNLIIDHFRRQKANNTVSSDEKEYLVAGNSMQHAEKSVEDQLAYDQVLKEVSLLMELLPPLQREVVFMRHYQGLSFKEIADETNVSINTALGRMRYAILNMRRMMEEKKLSFSV
ncbi:MAG: sigma-70 family RNA polymerase sigma factor [Breznakibacter sp.]